MARPCPDHLARAYRRLEAANNKKDIYGEETPPSHAPIMEQQAIVHAGSKKKNHRIWQDRFLACVRNVIFIRR